MSILKPIEAGSGFMKVSIFGDAGSGKTTTSVLLAIYARKHFQLSGPIVFIDTENGSPWAAPTVERETGQKMIGVKTRSFDDLKSAVTESIQMGAACVIVDSATHFWQELNATFLKRINDSRRQSGMQKLDRLEFQHMNAIKEMWGVWTSLFLNSPIHIITCGRLQNEWEMETNEKGKKELVKTGVRFQAERQFGHEASMLVEMEPEQILEGNRVVRVVHRATVIKDRNMNPETTLVGKTCDDPTGAFFLPHIETLRPAKHDPVDTSRETSIQVDEAGRADWQRELRLRTAHIEEMSGLFDAHGFGGTAGQAKEMRAKLAIECFGWTSGTKLESMPSETLRAGVEKLKVRLAEIAGAKEESK